MGDTGDTAAGIGAIDCVEPDVGEGMCKGTGTEADSAIVTEVTVWVAPGETNGAGRGAGAALEIETGRRRTVAGAAGVTGAAATASGTGTRAVERGLAEGGVGMPTAGAAGATSGAGPVAGRRRTVIGRGAPGTAGVTGEAPSGLAKGVTLGGIAPWGT